MFGVRRWTSARGDDTQHRYELLTELAERYRLLAENSSDVVLETGSNGLVLWASSSIEPRLGWLPEQIIGSSALDIVHADDVVAVQQQRSKVFAGEPVSDVHVRIRTSREEFRWMSAHSHPLRVEPDGSVAASVVSLRDCHTEVVNRRARDALAAGTDVLLRSRDELKLLTDMCQASVDKAGYLFAWYGRRVDDDAKSVERVAMSTEHAGYLDRIGLSWDSANPLGLGPTGTALRDGIVVIVHDFVQDASFQPWIAEAARHGFRSSIALPVVIGGEIDGVLTVYSAEMRAFDQRAVALLAGLAGQLGYGLQRLRDDVQLLDALREQSLLITAIEQTGDSVVITDTDANIVYANPATSRTSGYTLDELRGRNPRVFKSGIHDQVFYETMWARLLGGQSWRGGFVNRRKNGELYEETANIAPIHDKDGMLIAFVSVKHDLSAERLLEASIDRQQNDRDVMFGVMSRVRPAATLHGTSNTLCQAVNDLSGFAATAVVLLDKGMGLQIAGLAGDGLSNDLQEQPIPLARHTGAFAYLTARARSLHLADPGAVDVLGPELRHTLVDLGFTALGIGSILSDGHAVGAIVVGTRDVDGPARMPERRTLLEELGSFAGTLLGPQLDENGRAQELRADIRRIIDEQEYQSVFQPVVDLTTRQVCGYEALTRFDDGTPPDARFALAHSVGMGSELEVACIAAANEAAADLPIEQWLSLNLSPATVISGAARSFVEASGRMLVVEITEHARIENYPVLRRALSQLGPMKVSVDDAGAGFASLRHILELKPDFVKLDVALVRGIEADPARQALIVGLCHFAARTGAILIAEGIETVAEAETVSGLGVPFGQGYLLGRPGPLE